MLLLCKLPHCRLLAQPLHRYDSIDFKKLHLTHNKFINNIFQQAVSSISRDPGDGPTESYLNTKSEDPYMPHHGKIIRHITVKTLNFDRSFSDTTWQDRSLGARLGNRLHISTRKFIIRNNLFIRENTPVNAYMVADNERHIRSLGYIQDVRIIIDTIAGVPDSVDVTVYTKDLFSIAGGAAARDLNRFNANIYDANLAGMGQRVELSGLYDRNRNPNWGYGGYYRKDNVGHSYIDASVGYNTMSVNPYTRQEESLEFFSLYRRLVSPYSRFAGGLTLSRSTAHNLYNWPDSVYYNYKYELLDGWAGYAIGIRQLTASNNTIRDRRFLSVRLYNRNFLEEPDEVRNSNTFHPVFNTSQAALAQITFYRQDYYKTQYIYGFGVTEDVPYGYNISFTTGLHRQWHNNLFLERPYAGVNASQYAMTTKGDIAQFYLRTGGFLHQGALQDASYLLGTTAWSRVLFLGGTRIRQYANLSYARLHNRITYLPLTINNYFGPRGFLSDSVYGERRLSLQLETSFYLRLKLLGFQFAPFPYADLSLITPNGRTVSESQLYTSLGGGVRARNPNLVFETIEMRAFFFPVAPTNMRSFKVIINSHIRLRYNSTYVTQPDFVKLNAE